MSVFVEVVRRRRIGVSSVWAREPDTVVDGRGREERRGKGRAKGEEKSEGKGGGKRKWKK